VRKRLNRSICHLGCGLGWAEVNTSSIVFARWRHLANTIELSVCGSDAALCQITLTTCLPSEGVDNFSDIMQPPLAGEAYDGHVTVVVVDSEIL